MILMKNLKLSQQILSTLAIIIFLVSSLAILLLSLNKPEGILARLLGTLPIAIETSQSSSKISYSEATRIESETKFSFNNNTIVSNLGNITIDESLIKLDGLFYLELKTNYKIETLATKNIELTAGKYIIETNPLKIDLIQGNLLYNNKVITSNNNSATFAVNRFNVSNLDFQKFLESSNYKFLINSLEGFASLPTELNSVALSNNVIPVSETDDIVNTQLEVCELDLNSTNILCLINNLRISNSLNKLQANSELDSISKTHSEWMVNNNKLTSVDSSGFSFKERCLAIRFDCIDEQNFKLELNSSAQDLINLLIQKTILTNKDIKEIGIGLSDQFVTILFK